MENKFQRVVLTALLLVLAGLSNVALFAQTAGALPSAASPVLLTAEKKIVLVPASPASGQIGPPDDLSVVFDGRAQEVATISPVEDWRFVVYLDPALSTPDGLLAAASALSETASELVTLGTVEIVVADPFTESYLEASRDSDEVRSVLEEIAHLADAAGEILAIRTELAGIEALEEELELLHKSRLELLRWLATEETTGPTCLILLQDGFDLGGAFFQQLGTAPSDEFSQVLAQGTRAHAQLAATLASAGWTVMSMTPEAGQTPLLPGRSETLGFLAEATGGISVASAEELGSGLQQLKQAIEVTAKITSIPDGIPRPLEIRGSTPSLRAPQWTTVSTPITLSEIRALRTLEEPDLILGPLSTTAFLRPDPEAAPQPGGFAAILEALTDLRRTGRRQPVFRITLLMVQMESQPETAHDLVSPGSLAGAEAWLYRRRFPVPEDLAGGTVVVEELNSGNWGSAPLELSDSAIPTQGQKVAVWEATEPARQPRAAIGRRAEEQAVIRVLPPKKRPVVGKTRFETLVSSPIIDHVAFKLDGEEVATDDKAPFSATLELGAEVDMHTVEVVAFAANGARLGAHEITVNPRDDSFQVRITEIANPLGAIQTVTAQVRVPGESELDRVEFYWNETLVETMQQPPFQIELPVPDSGTQAFVRVAAYLTDGTWIDDAQLLGDASISERVEVNLIELHVVVTDRDDKPVEGLETEDFTIRLGRQEQEIQRLGFAEDVPLVLGVVIDTSESMWTLMVETQKAGAQFVANSLREGDSAFLVDFDTQPRLAQDTTTDMMTLLKTFGRFEADGATALYDAIIFSMLQFEEAEGRKALVLLTDGDDYKSRYGPRRCIQYGNRLGVPVYIISLAGVHNARRNLRRIDLEGITEGTGGQVFYIKEMGELTEAYAKINEELRSQYILTFTTDRELSEVELEEVDVSVAGRGLKVRGVVGGQRVQ